MEKDTKSMTARRIPIAPGHIPQPVLVKDGCVFYTTGYWSNQEDVTILEGHTGQHHPTSNDAFEGTFDIQFLQGEVSQSSDGQPWIRLRVPNK